MGKLWNDSSADALTSLTVVIGKNGAGKSTHFVDALNPEDVWILEKQEN
jgi:ABC-type Mn2+/Zn2+ transport system ATPase subunit